MCCEIRPVGDWHTAFVLFLARTLPCTCDVDLSHPALGGRRVHDTHYSCVCGALLTYFKRRADTSSCASAVQGCVRAHPPHVPVRSGYGQNSCLFCRGGGGGGAAWMSDTCIVYI